MTRVYETYRYPDESVRLGMAAGFVLMLAALLAAAVIAGTALLAAQPWDEDDSAATPDAPGLTQPVDGGPGAPEGGQ
jgi:hypothetical protein